MDASVTGTSQENESMKVGDIEKEKEIERRLRELGLWENKRLLESRVASMLEDHIDEKDVLSRTLRNCRRRRGGDGGGKTAIEEIRKIISPRVIRDCYGQKLAYHVNILMGCFTKNIEHEVINDVIVIRGSTAAEYDPKRLTKELRLELPPCLNMAALQVSYAAGAVKIRVPYLLEMPPSQKRSSESSDDPPCHQFASISPIYSMSMQLGSANRRKLGSSGAGSLSSDSPNSVTSLLSPPMPATPEQSIDLQPRSPILESPTPSLPSPYPVFGDDDTYRADGFAGEEGRDLERCPPEPAKEDSVGEAPRIFEENHKNGLTVLSERGSGVTPFVVDSYNETAFSEEFCHKSFSQDEFLRDAEVFKISNGIGHCISEEHGQMKIEENHNSSAVINDSNEDTVTSKRTVIVSDEGVDAKRIDDRLGNNYFRNGTSANMAAIYVNIADSRDINTDEDFDDATVRPIFKHVRRSTEVTSCDEKKKKYASPSDHSKVTALGYIGDNRQDERMILAHNGFNETSSTSAQRGQEWKTITGHAETRNTETSDKKDVPVAKANNCDERSAISVQRTFNPPEELDQNFINGRTENESNFESDAKEAENNGHYLSATDLYDKSRSHEKDESKSASDKAAFENDYEDEEHFSLKHLCSETAIMPQGIPMLGKSLSEKKYFSLAMPRDDSGVGLSVQEKSCDEKFFGKNCLREDEADRCNKFDTFGEKEEQVSRITVTDNYQDRGKVTQEDISDESWMKWTKDKNTSSFKQNHQREEQDVIGVCSATEESDSTANNNRRQMSPRPKEPNGNLNSLLDSLEETVL